MKTIHNNHSIILAAIAAGIMLLSGCDKSPSRNQRYLFEPGKKTVTWAGDGNDTTIFLKVSTNIPSSQIEVYSDGWMEARYTDNGVVEVRISPNNGQSIREGSVVVTDRKYGEESACLSVRQGYVPVIKPGTVPFRDCRFKEACLEFADTNHDGEVSLDEALAVQEVNIAGRGIRDISGIECFSKAWKLDAQDNDIVDGTNIRHMHQLYWLDLKGNKNLKTFNLMECTAYFEHCEFEVTDDLVYFTFKRQLGVSYKSDPYTQHSRQIDDPRRTNDWSRLGELKLVSEHTEGPGKLAMVFTGGGWLDVDVNDGTFHRVLKGFIDALKKETGWRTNWKYFDIYTMVYLIDERNKFAKDLTYDNQAGMQHKAVVETNEYAEKMYSKVYESVNNKYIYIWDIENYVDPHGGFRLDVSHSITWVNPCGKLPIDKHISTFNSSNELVKDCNFTQYLGYFDKYFPDWKNFD